MPFNLQSVVDLCAARAQHWNPSEKQKQWKQLRCNIERQCVRMQIVAFDESYFEMDTLRSAAFAHSEFLAGISIAWWALRALSKSLARSVCVLNNLFYNFFYGCHYPPHYVINYRAVHIRHMYWQDAGLLSVQHWTAIGASACPHSKAVPSLWLRKSVA